MTPGENAPSAAALRAEHDALGEKLAVRRSIDVLRRALYLLFFGLLTVGIAVKLAPTLGAVQDAIAARFGRG